ncbi:MAG: translation initiation factor IF-2 N-terminal domain-containing protein, partial [Phycisphaerae bacterium]|nr:translation initiation factor IF-2 N-terminal domain-containing protein [Phycisphaerae bacterium]
TEALVAIDVNSGRSRSARDSETNAFNTNCEAVDEICRQLRLRDLGGLIINDLIDMRHHRHRRSIEERFQDNLKRDRARSTILKISEFGLVEMTRQRMRPSMRKSHFMTCPQCEGHGEIKAPDSVAADVARQVSFLLDQKRVQRLEIVCSPRVASVLLSRRRRQLVRLEDATGKAIDVRVSDDIPVDRVDYYAYDDRNADIDVTRLPAAKLPTLSDLQREAAAAEGGEAAATEETAEVGRKKRSRRRRRPGPADATAIALAGGFEDDDEEEEEVRPEGKKRSRRRRRRRKSESGAGEATTSTPRDTEAQVETAAETETKDQPAEVGAADDGAPVRIHQLAKEIGVPSREIVSRCKEGDEIEVRNHMSSVTAAEARTIRGWFGVDATEPPVLEADGADAKPAKTGRKRRRRGGRRRGRGDGPAPDATQTETSAGSEETASDDGKPQPAADDDTERAPRKRSRRGRRGGRRRRGGNDDESTPPEPQNADAAAPAPAREEPEPVASPAEVTPKPDPAAAKPKRRTLYGGSRRRLSTADREALEIEK